MTASCATKTVHPDGTKTQDSPQVSLEKRIGQAKLLLATTLGSVNGLEKTGDLTTEDHMHFYQYDKLVLTLKNKDGQPYGKSWMWKQLDDYMKESNFFVNVWWISDHGNAHLMSRRAR